MVSCAAIFSRAQANDSEFLGKLVELSSDTCTLSAPMFPPKGKGNREQRFYILSNNCINTYSIIWNPKLIRFVPGLIPDCNGLMGSP
ncbi:hypothetical protein RHSIM_Rhsim06G0116900 [Rhododendron simsii]|uniref:Uncharacterized protein n=1 Tax=Rhododendron simsii TaxID=118357 RepID=A0A834LN78_RHOSS|nr:hypothetical protein RHSIM_Rhsim06G0116900 [Rhododendron simsii]